MSALSIPPEAIGLRLAKIVSGRLVCCEKVYFAAGAAAVETTLRRAAISGRVEVNGEIGDYWADILTDHDGTWERTVSLDRKSYSALKNRWMRCKLET